MQILDTEYIIVHHSTYFLRKGDGAMTEQYTAVSTMFCNDSSAHVDLRIRMLSVLLSILLLPMHVLLHEGAFIPERS